MKYITLPIEQRKDLERRFSVTRVCVWLALCYKRDSDLCRRIREAALETYCILCNEEKVGGVVLKIDKREEKGELLLLFVSPRHHSKGIGYAAWCTVKRLHPEIKLRETFTPYFETRNIHFYVNRCGFRIVEYYNSHNPLPGNQREYMSENGDFRFEKLIK